jgi:hypothetical protein
MLAVLAIAVVVLWPWNRVSLAKVKRLKVGMTKWRVMATIGPPGDYTGGAINPRGSLSSLVDIADDTGRSPKTVDANATSLSWACDDGYFEVFFDRDSKVLLVFFRPCFREQESTMFDSFVWRAKRQWHRWSPEK